MGTIAQGFDTKELFVTQPRLCSASWFQKFLSTKNNLAYTKAETISNVLLYKYSEIQRTHTHMTLGIGRKDK